MHAAEPAATEPTTAEPVAEPDDAVTLRFTESHPTFLAFVSVALAIFAMLAHELPEARVGHTSNIACLAVITAARVAAHRMADQRRARTLISWA